VLILRKPPHPERQGTYAASPLNAVWLGTVVRPLPLPQVGHLFLFFPLAGGALAWRGVTVDAENYLLSGATETQPKTVTPVGTKSELLLLLLSPGFIHEMADFLGIESSVEQLLKGMPLLRGDAVSRLLEELAQAVRARTETAAAEELFLELVGHILRRLRRRKEALLRLDRHRKSTIADLLPRLLRARQFVEARHLTPLSTAEVAAHVTLSEAHFARLFRTAFDVTVHQYVMRLRLDEARRRLETGEEPVTEIALAVGYRSLSSFTHAFRRRYGLAPGKYRKRLDRPVES
jgi:AraC-like DNA-binding protein